MHKISIKQFSNCESGNMSIMLAVTSLMLLGGIGLAIETSDVHKLRSTLQDACDSVALAQSISIQNGGNLDKDASRVLMEENFLYEPSGLSLEMQDISGKVTCNATYIKETKFGSVLGLNELTINVSSAATAITIPESINLSVDLTNISSDARNWNQLYVYTYEGDFDINDFEGDFDINDFEGDFDINDLENRTLLVENKTGVSNEPGDQDYIAEQTQSPHSIPIIAGHKFGFELSSTNKFGVQNRYFSDLSPENLEIENSDCFSGTRHSWEDRIDGGDGDFNDMEYTVSCEYEGGEKTLSVTSRLVR